MNALIGSGMCATSESEFAQRVGWFLDVWLPNVGNRNVIVVDNSDYEDARKLGPNRNVRVINVLKNLQHVGAMLGKTTPKFCGWSMSWMIPAHIAYCEGRDFIYQESDCLCFGNWEQQIMSDMETGGLLMAFGAGSPLASVEQSLFAIKHEFILDALLAYTTIPASDGNFLPEDKFELMARMNPKIGRHSLPGGRNRPLPYDAPAWSAQKFSSEEMDEIRKRGLV